MKNKSSSIVIAFFLFIVVTAHAQYNEWTWVNGAVNGTIVYGTMGVPDSNNTPGSVYEATEWTDHNGNFWLLKGQNFWKYDPVINMWTWMKSGTANYGTQGIASASNYPGALTFAVSTWTDNNNDLWLYGGVSSSSSFAGNLWKYNIASGMWTWMKGPGTCACNPGVYGTKGVAAPANYPPGRAESSCTWIDSAGNLWLFGGQTPSTCSCAGQSGSAVGWSDLWKYDVGTNNWTWMSGPNIPSQPAVYGTKGIPSTANTPGGRWAYASGKQLNGEFLFFGGAFNGSTSALKNDLWKYNPATDEWTWLSGLSTNNDLGTFGTKCVSDMSNIPRSCIETRSRWTDDCGNLWLIGSSVGNALWRYSVANNTWTWVKGTNLTMPPAVHGIKGVSDPANTPPGVSGGSPWRSGSDFFLLYDVLYRYKPDKPTASFTSVNSNACIPLKVNFTNTSTPGCNEIKSYLWNFGDSTSGANDTSTSANPSHTFNHPGTYSVRLTVINCTGSKDSVSSILNIPACIKAVFTASDSVFCNEGGSCIDFFDQSTNNPTSWKWYFPGAVPDTSTQQNPTNICYLTPGTYPVTLIVSNSNGSDTLTVSSMIVFASTAAPPVLTLSGDTIYCSHAVAYQWYFNGSPIGGATDSFYVATVNGIYAVQITDSNGCTRLSNGFPVSVNELSSSGGIRIYPNPVGERLWVVGYGLWVGRQGTIGIYNVLGEKVHSQKPEPRISDLKPQTIDVSGLSKGVYMVELNYGDEVYRIKFVKE